jgi:transposase
MTPVPTGVRVWLATGHTDMRKGFASLSLQVQEVLRRDPLNGHLFCFRGRRGDLLKVIWHDGQGACLFTKKLERGRFIWPSLADGVVSISQAQNRLARSPGVLASDERGLRVCRLNLAANMIPSGYGLQR